MSIEYKVIGRHIRAARNQKKMTQEAVAEAIDMSSAHFGNAMRTAAKAAVAAAKSELKIASPSGVFRDEIGRMTMKGFGQGALLESKAQARVLRNATRYLTGAAKEGAVAYSTSDNRRTYTSQNTISFAGSNFYINDKQDAFALAVEIASLTRRQQRGRGLRMA